MLDKKCKNTKILVKYLKGMNKICLLLIVIFLPGSFSFYVFPQRECILSIAEFVRENPRASQAQINAEVEKRVLVFAAQVQALEAAPLF